MNACCDNDGARLDVTERQYSRRDGRRLHQRSEVGLGSADLAVRALRTGAACRNWTDPGRADRRGRRLSGSPLAPDVASWGALGRDSRHLVDGFGGGMARGPAPGDRSRQRRPSRRCGDRLRRLNFDQLDRPWTPGRSPAAVVEGRRRSSLRLCPDHAPDWRLRTAAAHARLVCAHNRVRRGGGCSRGA